MLIVNILTTNIRYSSQLTQLFIYYGNWKYNTILNNDLCGIFDHRTTETANSWHSKRVLDKCHRELDESAEHIRSSTVFTLLQIR